MRRDPLEIVNSKVVEINKIKARLNSVLDKSKEWIITEITQANNSKMLRIKYKLKSFFQRKGDFL